MFGSTAFSFFNFSLKLKIMLGTSCLKYEFWGSAGKISCLFWFIFIPNKLKQTNVKAENRNLRECSRIENKQMVPGKSSIASNYQDWKSQLWKSTVHKKTVLLIMLICSTFWISRFSNDFLGPLSSFRKSQLTKNFFFSGLISICKGAAIKAQMLPEFNPTENGTSFMKAWQTKMQNLRRKWAKILTRIKSAEWTCKHNNMYYVLKQYQKLTEISKFTENFLYLCQRL